MRYFPTLVCFLFIFFLFLNDRQKKNHAPSVALWIPITWMFLAGSRYVSAWLNLGQPIRAAFTYDEGSPIDAVAFSLLIAAGAFVLLRRKVDWGRLLVENKWICLYFFYCGLSIAWSDNSLVSFKRFIKELGNLIMVLVILTEKRPYEAVGVILRRLIFLWLPLSVLFIRYYPELGRGYTIAGGQMFTGIGHQKNDLGSMCLISGIYFAWIFLLKREEGFNWGKRINISNFILIGMVIWLLNMSQSATSLACLVVAVGLFFVSSIKSIERKPGRIIVLMMVAASIFFVLDETLDVGDIVIKALGRDESLTTRVPAWKLLEEVYTNPIVGTGFMSFWSGERLYRVWAKLGSTIIQAHNGYLEQYLNLGYIGVAFIGIIMFSGLLKARRHLNFDYPAAMLRLCFISIAVFYNYTEAAFYGINNLWLLLLFGIIEVPYQKRPMSEISNLDNPAKSEIHS
jgi:exopolysaccharide production protein ExoQ